MFITTKTFEDWNFWILSIRSGGASELRLKDCLKDEANLLEGAILQKNSHCLNPAHFDMKKVPQVGFFDSVLLQKVKVSPG